MGWLKKDTDMLLTGLYKNLFGNIPWMKATLMQPRQPKNMVEVT